MISSQCSLHSCQALPIGAILPILQDNHIVPMSGFEIVLRRTCDHAGTLLTEGVNALPLGDFEVGEVWSGGGNDKGYPSLTTWYRIYPFGKPSRLFLGVATSNGGWPSYNSYGEAFLGNPL